MKKMLLVLTLLSLMVISCSKSKNLQFCEGISMEGDGVNCGTEFESGELTALITSNDPFGQEKIDVEIYEIGDNSKEKIEAIHINVKSTDKKANATLPLYTEGKYHIKALVKDKTLAEGDITIIDY